MKTPNANRDEGKQAAIKSIKPQLEIVAPFCISLHNFASLCIFQGQPPTPLETTRFNGNTLFDSEFEDIKSAIFRLYLRANKLNPFQLKNLTSSATSISSEWQTPHNALFWSLEFLWSLELGSWSLPIRSGSQRQSTAPTGTKVFLTFNL
jgi:hypothetical protein